MERSAHTHREADGARTNAIDVTFTLTTNEPARICWRLDGGAPTCSAAGVTSFSAGLQNLTRGNHSLSVTAFDGVGNEGTTERVWTVDLTEPTLTISAPPSEGATTAPPPGAR